MVRHVHRKARTEGFANVTAQVAKSDNPSLPRDADLIFVCDVLLHVKQRAEWLKAIHSQMRSGAKLVLIDFREGQLPEGPPEKIKVPKAEVIRMCKEAGFTLREEHPDLLPYQQFLVFQRP
jgi:hypothetical protein